MRRKWAMCARGKWYFVMHASVSFLLAVVLTAAADNAPDTAGGNPASVISSLDSASNLCVDLNADCSSLMVNYYGDSVEFSLLQSGSLKGRAYSTHDKLPDGGKVKPDSNEQMLGIDFLRGFNTTSDTRAFKGEFSVNTGRPVETSSMHDWTFTAATSINYRFQQANPDGIAAPTILARDSLTFWDFEHVYQWEVKEDVRHGGRYDLSQVALSNIYFSSKVNSNSNPEVVVCEVNGENFC